MDAYGHVNNARFLTYLEEARVDLLVRLAEAVGVDSLGAGVLVKQQEIEYLLPVRYGDPLRIELTVREVRAAAFRLDYRVYVHEALVAVASSLLVSYDIAAGRVRRIRPAEREFLLSAEPPPPAGRQSATGASRLPNPG